MTSLRLHVTRFGFSLLERVSPQRAGHLAFQLFCRTPSRKPKNRAHATVLQRAERQLFAAERLDLRIFNGLVATYLFRPTPERSTGRVSLVVHGWGSRTGDMLTVINSLTQAGETVVSLDLPGHGASSGRALTMVSAVAAVDAAWRQYGPFHAMVGHSFGGAVIVNAAGGNNCWAKARIPQKIVTIASPSSLKSVFTDVQRMLGLGSKARDSMDGQVLRIAGRPLSSFESSEQLKRTPVPVLVIHARDDKEVAASHAELMADAGEHIHLHWADGLGHRRIIANRDVASRVSEFVTNPTPDA